MSIKPKNNEIRECVLANMILLLLNIKLSEIVDDIH